MAGDFLAGGFSKDGREFRMPRKLTQAVVETLELRAQVYVTYDSAVPGFGCRVTPAGARSWIFDYRPGGGRHAPTRRMTLGRIEALSHSNARKLAQSLYHRTRLGEDPAGARDKERATPTVGALIERFMIEEAEPTLKPATVTLYRKYFKNHIIPVLGRKQISGVTYSDVVKLHRAIGARGFKVAANRVVALISVLYGWAEKAGEVTRGTNPARGVTRFKEEARTRKLSHEEMARLGATLALAETEGLPFEVDDTNPTSKHAPKPENRRTVLSPFATGAIRLLLFTGCRLGEILALQWDDVDFEQAFLVLHDSKTGPRHVWLNAAALAVLEQLRQIRMGAYVIAGDRPDVPRRDLNRPWRQIVHHAELVDVTLHTLRHTHGSVGAGAGLGLIIIGELLGHRHATTTKRYAHVANDPARRASETIGAEIAAALERRPTNNIIGMDRGKRP
jgi:integrase